MATGPSPWAAPDTPAESDAPPARRRRAGVARVVPAVTQPVPVPLRPLTLGEVLDGAFETMRVAPALILGLSALVVVPAELAMTWFERDLLDGNGSRYLLERPWRYLVDSGADGQDPTTLAVWAHLGLRLVVPALVAVAIGRVLSAWYAGTAISPRAAIDHLVRRAWVVVVLAPLRGLAALGLGLPLVMLCLTGPIAGVEATGPVRSVTRSWELVQRRFWATTSFYLASAFMVTVLTVTLNLLAVILGDLALGSARWVFTVTVSIGVSVVASAFVAAGTCLHYLDSRVRVEGLDLDLLLVDSFEERR